ncbi:hypothetical protein EYZ11_011244 [Aspergillus tanneri]|uniref:Uncharacterized protein n=1 Tax=Aspergillus tanneri TaxID=1220188 RepID=A0A4S3J5F9_9EURO|nr:uncharacterized protein ATNIH1004_009757 [Aspergillus tanneri]KAA8642995.1 hypothetical protein ATNIH1004_009757 [Aspergillus tanneri]THC89307.1 hypothetical protein EYZ11_011244 [Aspergillus tanneri]
MYEPAGSLHLPYIKQQPLPRRYESEEEDISEPELSGQENALSPVETCQEHGTFDSDASADELSNADPSESVMEKAALPCLLSPLPSSRPVSMDTVKRSSSTTYVADSYIFDRDESVIIELPSPDSTSPLHSPSFLQPNVYMPPDSPAPSSTRRSSASSIYSDDGTDLLVAERVTYVGPMTKPNIVLISPVTEHSSPVSEKSMPASTAHRATSKSSRDQLGFYNLKPAASSQPFLGSAVCDNARSRKSGLRLNTTDLGGPSTESNRQFTGMPESAPPKSHCTHSMSSSRPKTAVSEKASLNPFTRSRAPTDSLRRPPSIQSIRSAHVPFFHGRNNSMYPGDDSYGLPISCSPSAASSDFSVSPLNSRPPSRTPSPASYYNSPTFARHRSNSVYSVSSVPGNKSNHTPLPIRNSLMKSSTASSVYSSSSLRSEVDSVHSLDPNDLEETDEKLNRLRRKKSLRRFKEPKTDPEQTTKSFMGFMLRSKRKSISVKQPNA